MRQLKISGERITNRTGSISRYFNEVDRIPLLSSEEEFQIGLLAQKGDQDAVQRLISSNLRFVISVAKQYSNAFIPLEELICQGNIGLCDAAKIFDPTRGFKFISFAVWHIRKEILLYINNSSRTVRLPQNIITDLAKIKRAEDRIQQIEQRSGTVEEIYEEMLKEDSDITLDNVKRVLRSDSSSIPLESTDIEEGFSPLNWIESGSTASELADARDLRTAAIVALSRLNETQRQVVMDRLGIITNVPETFDTISKKYDRTPEWARQMYTKSLKIMKVKLNRANLTQDKMLNLDISPRKIITT